jgi:hypothetical protein
MLPSVNINSFDEVVRSFGNGCSGGPSLYGQSDKHLNPDPRKTKVRIQKTN